MQVQYQTARLNAPGRSVRKTATSRLGWLGNLGVGQKLSLIAFTFGIPLSILTALMLSERQAQIQRTTNELYGLQKTVPLAAVSSGIYVYVDGIIRGNAKDAEAGVQEANQGFKTLSTQLGGRAAERLEALESDWKNLQIQGKSGDNFTLLNNYQILLQSNQQQLVAEMLMDAGLNAEANPTLAALISANQSLLPEMAGQIQLTALYTKALKAAPNDPMLIRLAVRNTTIAENTLTSYEENLKRAYSMQPELKDRIGAVNAKTVNTTRQALFDTGRALRDSKITPELTALYSQSLNQMRDSYKATITEVGTQLMNRVKANYVALAVQVGLIGLTLLATFFLLVTLARSIVRPLNTLTRASRAIAEGNLDVQVPVQTNDELGVMARTFNSAAEQLRLNAERNEHERLESQKLQSNISEFLDVTMDIAEGDLTKRGKVTDDVLGNVVDSINLMTEELAQVLKGVQSASSSVTGGSQSMLETTRQIQQGADLTTQETQRVAQQARQMNASITQMAAIAQATSESARRALIAADKGQEAVQGTLQGMQSIRQSSSQVAERIQSLAQRSEQIQEIVDSITHIASQTNLLSLHASIEAAGAGEAGGRFAVVADEVRQLADLSTDATARVTSLIERVQADIAEVAQSMNGNTQQVEEGYSVAEQAGERLREISELAQVSAHFAQNISTATKTQVQGVQQMGGAVQQIAGIAQRSQASVEQGRHTAEQLEQLARQLNATLARFRLPA